MNLAPASTGRPIEGCGTALITPFRGEVVDYDAVTRLVDAQVASGVGFLVPAGTTGESPTLSDDERLALIDRVLQATRGRVPVVAGTGTYDTRHSVDLSRAARRAGADACLAVAPYYNKPSQEGLYRHFRTMIDRGGLPVVLYHIPARTVVGIDIETVARVAAGGGVVAIKESGSVDRVTRLRELTGVPVLSGDDGLTLSMIALGAVGVVSVASNVVPAAVSQLVRLARAGESAAALAVHEQLAPLVRALFLESNPVPVKAAMALTGLCGDGSVRLPLVEASSKTRVALKKALRTFEPAAAKPA